jgi:uncharacterized RDD family membrane protein YckC
MLPGLTAMGLFVLHTGLAELFTARSLGKALLGLRVLEVKGAAPGWGQMLARNAMKLFELVAWLLLVLPLVSPHRQRLGDVVARTLVVRRAPEAPEA